MSGIIYEHVSTDGDERFHIDLGDDRNMTVNVTGEGIIFDVFGLRIVQVDGMVYDDVHLGTVGMTYEEWGDWVSESHIPMPDSKIDPAKR
jgi:hypothetical protein